MKSWARAEPMDPWAHGLSPGPKKKWRRAGSAHDFIIISYILICMYIFPYIFARKPLGNPLGKPPGNPLGNWNQIGTPC